MKRKKIDSNGSSLVFLIITISIIVIIDTVILSLAVMNFKMKKLNSQVKKAFYLADAGIDEAYIITKEFSYEAIKYAINKVEDYNEIEQLSKKRYFNNQSYTNKKNDGVFQSAFKDYFKGNCKDIVSSKGLKDLLNDNGSYLKYDNGISKIDANLTENTNSFFVEIKSTYIYQNISIKIVLYMKVKIPEYDTKKIYEGIYVDDLIEIIEWKIER